MKKMSLKTRIIRAENLAHNQGKGQRRIFVLYEGKDFGHWMNGTNHEEIPLSEFMACRQENDVLLKVQYKRQSYKMGERLAPLEGL
jgi:hypothetical protein